MPIVSLSYIPATTAAMTDNAVVISIVEDFSYILDKWRALICAISCASTPANSASVFVFWIIPELIPIMPPGAAKALMSGLFITKNL